MNTCVTFEHKSRKSKHAGFMNMLLPWKRQKSPLFHSSKWPKTPSKTFPIKAKTSQPREKEKINCPTQKMKVTVGNDKVENDRLECMTHPLRALIFDHSNP